MRTQLLGLAAAALTAGTLSLGLATAPAHAIGGLDSGTISATGTLPTDVAVVATTPGDGMAAWVRPAPGGFRIQAAQGTNGAFAPPVNVTPAAVTSATDLQLVGNAKGDVVAVWTQVVDGEEVVRGARYLGGVWDGAVTLSSAGITSVDSSDAAIDDAGQVQVVTGIHDGPSTEVHLAIWPKGHDAAVSMLSQQASVPSIAMTPSGKSVLAWQAAGVIPKVRVTRRDTNGAFTPFDDVSWPDVVNTPNVGVADDGRATVAFYGYDDGYARVVTSDVSSTGEAGPTDIVSPAGLSGGPYSLEVAPDGRVTVSWVNWSNGTEALRLASRPAGGDFTGGWSTVQSGMPDKPSSAVFARSDGRQVVVHDLGGKLTFRHRSNPAFTFGTYAAGTADGLFAADADSQGSVVAVSVVDDGASSYIQGDWLDTTAPTAAVTGPGAQVTSKAYDVTWSSADALSGTKTTDVISSSAAWNSATFSTPSVVGDNLVSGPLHVTGGLGRTYCYEVQSIDKANNLGLRSTRKCTAVPLDDKALLGSGWSRTAKAGQFNGTWTTTSTKGRTLTRPGIKAKRLALVANRVGNGGLVEVRWNGTLIRKISLKGAAATKKVLPIVTWGTVHTGTLKIKVISASGRPVRIDGLVVAK